jgi:aryl-alcohol dehydrogenase-like predicted oxidoreductase
VESAAENAIQFARSTPGHTTSLTGMGDNEHVIANLKLALLSSTPAEEWNKLFVEG